MKRNPFLTTAFIFAGCLFMYSCDSTSDKATEEKQPPSQEPAKEQSEIHGTEIKPGDVTLTTPLNKQWVTAGENMYNLKCQACHKLTEERLVGPGWSGVTKRREPHWIMNMITNVEMMLESDPEAQKLLEQCLVRMPNLSLSKDQSREVLEFMRKNDGVK